MTLCPDSTYTMVYHYIDREPGDDGDDAVSGTFRWDKGRNVIALDAENFPPYYRVGEDRLIQLDMEGNPITGDLADNYVLTFRSASLAGQQDAGTLAPLPCPVIPPKETEDQETGDGTQETEKPMG
jgi:hypothetical protein